MPSRMRKTLLTSVLCSSLLASACSNGLIKSLGDLARLRQQLIDKYHEQDIRVNLQNSRYLTIIFVNSPLNQQAAAVRAKRAQEAAKFVVSNYPAIGKIGNIWISFVASETRLIIFHYSNTIEAFAFDNTGAEMDLGRSEKADDRTPVARFNPARNETDVSITRLQLEGDLNHGIAMVPHFTVAGNVHDSNSKLGVPSLVVVDFASYADRKIFSENAKLEIRCDGVPAFSGNALLLTPQDSGSEGSTAQFLEAQIPIQQFAKMGSSREVKIKLGSKAFELSPADINALRAMTDYAPLPHTTR
ncbi:MAG TPA: hypothetical protein VLQ90_10100 [Pyrinomonadaceae bacterium]|nr:hypothetical protein [Pyrinomonadaceae bacterium]